jgi:hypothetical protein
MFVGSVSTQMGSTPSDPFAGCGLLQGITEKLARLAAPVGRLATRLAPTIESCPDQVDVRQPS